MIVMYFSLKKENTQMAENSRKNEFFERESIAIIVKFTISKKQYHRIIRRFEDEKVYSPMIPPDCDPDGDEAEEAHSGKAKKCDSKRDCHIEQPETGQKRQEQHRRDNEFPTLQSLGCLFNQNSFIHGDAPSSCHFR